jgi:formamidopyrimidine-DNA glycosylase
MPELPEVETIVKYLKTKVLHRTFVNVWTDCEKLIKKPRSFDGFKKGLVGERITGIQRRGKNILFELSHNKILLVHQKMTGHLLCGKWKLNEKWQSEIKGPLSDDPGNGFLHLVFFLDDKSQLALSDLRKFAKVELWDKKDLYESEYMKSLGPSLWKNIYFQKVQRNNAEKGKDKAGAYGSVDYCRHRKHLFRRNSLVGKNSSLKRRF